jgi:hypothetical protein
MNIDQYPKRYRIEFIEPGIVNYDDVDQGKVFVSREALDRMKSSYIGKPVVNEVHKNLTAKEAFKLTDEERESLADGVVYNCGWLDNGWCFADVIIWDLNTQDNIDKNGYSASCAYVPNEKSNSGKWHGFDFDEEVKNGVYTHMAIVKDPRYEGASIYELSNEYQNSKKADELWNQYLNSKKIKEKHMSIFKFLLPKEKRNDLKPEGEKSEEIKENEDVPKAEDSYIEIDGNQVPLMELIKTWQAEQKEKEVMQNVINPEDEIDVDGKKIKAQELVDSYMRNKSKMNAEETPEEIEKKKKEKEMEAKENAKGKNGFQKIENAMRNNDDAYKIVINTKDDRIANGKSRYGSREAK